MVKPVMFGLTAETGVDSNTPAAVDYRLARNATLRALRTGEMGRSDACDAQMELLRNAQFCGRPAERVCPVCQDDGDEAWLVEVTYVFGSRLPKHGRCITTDDEIKRLRKRVSPATGFVVEVCTACGWNHLMRRITLGGGPVGGS